MEIMVDVKKEKGGVFVVSNFDTIDKHGERGAEHGLGLNGVSLSCQDGNVNLAFNRSAVRELEDPDSLAIVKASCVEVIKPSSNGVVIPSSSRLVSTKGVNDGMTNASRLLIAAASKVGQARRNLSVSQSVDEHSVKDTNVVQTIVNPPYLTSGNNGTALATSSCSTCVTMAFHTSLTTAVNAFPAAQSCFSGSVTPHTKLRVSLDSSECPERIPEDQPSRLISGCEHVLEPRGGRTSVVVPYLWKRVLEDGVVVYYSPANDKLASLTRVKEHLLSDKTCKCGLTCPFRLEKVFNFDANVQSESCTLLSIDILSEKTLYACCLKKHFRSHALSNTSHHSRKMLVLKKGGKSRPLKDHSASPGKTQLISDIAPESIQVPELAVTDHLQSAVTSIEHKTQSALAANPLSSQDQLSAPAGVISSPRAAVQSHARYPHNLYQPPLMGQPRMIMHAEPQHLMYPGFCPDMHRHSLGTPSLPLDFSAALPYHSGPVYHPMSSVQPCWQQGMMPPPPQCVITPSKPDPQPRPRRRRPSSVSSGGANSDTGYQSGRSSPSVLSPERGSKGTASKRSKGDGETCDDVVPPSGVPSPSDRLDLRVTEPVTVGMMKADLTSGCVENTSPLSSAAHTHDSPHQSSLAISSTSGFPAHQSHNQHLNSHQVTTVHYGTPLGQRLLYDPMAHQVAPPVHSGNLRTPLGARPTFYYGQTQSMPHMLPNSHGFYYPPSGAVVFPAYAQGTYQPNLTSHQHTSHPKVSSALASVGSQQNADDIHKDGQQAHLPTSCKVASSETVATNTAVVCAPSSTIQCLPFDSSMQSMDKANVITVSSHSPLQMGHNSSSNSTPVLHRAPYDGFNEPMHRAQFSHRIPMMSHLGVNPSYYPSYHPQWSPAVSGSWHPSQFIPGVMGYQPVHRMFAPNHYPAVNPMFLQSPSPPERSPKTKRKRKSKEHCQDSIGALSSPTEGIVPNSTAGTLADQCNGSGVTARP